MDTIRHLLSQYRLAAIGLITLLTLGVVATVLLATTSAGCGAADKFGVKSSRCLKPSPVAHLGSPSPLPVSPSPSAPASPSPSPTQSPVYTPPPVVVPPTATGASSSAPPLAGAASGLPVGTLSCRLPIYAAGPGSGGFIVLPGQAFIADPRSAGTVPSPSPGSPSPSPPGYGGGYPGWYGLTYDAAYKVWVPVPFNWVSPDGAHYAYPLIGDLYVQDVANGTQIELGSGQSLTPVGVENNG